MEKGPRHPVEVVSALELKQLHQFQMIAQLGNLTKAAEALQLAQPNLSRTLSALEREIGAPLFDRQKGKGLVLNENGRLLYEMTERLFLDIESTVQEIKANSGERLSSLRVAMSAVNTVSECISEFHENHPDILLFQMTCSEKQLQQLLLQKEADIGITFAQPDNPVIAAVELARFDIAVGVSFQNALAQYDEIPLQSLKSYRFLCNEIGINQSLTERICRRAGFSPTEALILGDSRLIDRQLSQKDYVTLFPVENKDQEIPMKILRITDYPQQVSLWACYHKRRPYEQPIAELLAMMQAYYSDHGTESN